MGTLGREASRLPQSIGRTLFCSGEGRCGAQMGKGAMADVGRYIGLEKILSNSFYFSRSYKAKSLWSMKKGCGRGGGEESSSPLTKVHFYHRMVGFYLFPLVGGC